MSNKETAYICTDDAVLTEYVTWRDSALAIHKRRAELVEAVGRNVWVNGSGYSTRVTGFERFESDVDGDVLHHGGCLVVSSRRGQHEGRVVPNLRRKAGKEFAEELSTYTVPHLSLTGLPQMHVYSSGMGLVMGHATVHLWGNALYALWGCDNTPMGEQWEKIPLSVYHASREKWDAADDAVVSGNEDSA